MPRRIWSVIQTLLTIGSAGCCAYLLIEKQHEERAKAQPHEDRVKAQPRNPDQADWSLRSLLQAKHLSGTYVLPDDVRHCAIVIEEFADGKYQRRFPIAIYSPARDGNRELPFSVLWGHTGSGFRAVFSVQHGAYVTSEGDDSFFAKLDGERSWGGGQANSKEYRGLRVIGYAASKETQQGPRGNAFGGFEQALHDRKYVAILGVKFFETEEEAIAFTKDFSERPES